MKEELNEDMESLRNNYSEVNSLISQIKHYWTLGKQCSNMKIDY
jgi:hypothetical protein